MHYTFGASSRRVGDVFEGGAGGGPKACALRKELGDLDRIEKALDELIYSSTAQLKQLTDCEDNQKYPLHAAACLSVSSLSLVTHAHFVSAAVLTLDSAMYVGLCDVSGHSLHWEPAGPNGHRRQGPS